jgi:DNA polymerase III delta prime subunit
MSANFSFQEILSPYDFELLVRDLLSRDLGIELRAFAEGGDRGIDLRYSADPTGTTVVQCKRTKDISKKLLELEAQKIAKLPVAKYYLAVASELSVAKCDQISGIFSKWMTNDRHIYSKNRLNKLLDQYPEVLREHYKLWINSSELFDQFINNDLLGRSKFLMEDIAQSLKYYVKNEGYHKAVDSLNRYSFIIISGIPGIGKTTLARILLWEYVQQGFEIIEIRNVNEGERILKEDERKKQVLYFDDFLGENFLHYDVIQGRANDVYMFMKRFFTREGGKKKLIMTTREYILNQARGRYAKLNREEVDISRYILDLGEYSEINKALILYNHLYYSDVKLEYIRDILKDDRYEEIIDHRNYSPRIVEAMTIHLSGIPPEQYAGEFIANLENPLRIWQKAFESELSEYSQYILYILASLGSSVLMDDLENAFRAFCSEAALELHPKVGQNSFRDSVREMLDTFIQISITKYGEYRIEFPNHSIRDFLVNRIMNDTQILQTLVSSSLFLNQLFYIFTNFVKDRHAELIGAVIARLINYWHSFRSSRLIQWFGEENSWHRSDINLFERLYLVSTYFDLNQQPMLRDIVIADFDKLDLTQSHDSSDLSQYVRILAKLVVFRKFDATEIMNSYIDNMNFTSQMIDFTEFKNVFPPQYDDFVSSNLERISRRVNDLIHEDLDYIHGATALDALIVDIESIEIAFGLSLSSKRHDALEKLSMLEDEEPSTDNEHLPRNAYEEDKTASEIMSLFREEMFVK